MSELDRSVIFSDEENCVSQSSKKKQPNKRKAQILSESENEGAPVENMRSALTKEVRETPSTEGSSMEAEPDCFAELKNNLDQMIVKHRQNLREIRRKEKANNNEFLSTMQHYLIGEKLVVDNSRSSNAVVVNDFNCMELQAGVEPSKFGRELAKKIFGEEENCQLITHMIGHGRNLVEMRPRVDLELELAFES